MVIKKLYKKILIFIIVLEILFIFEVILKQISFSRRADSYDENNNLQETKKTSTIYNDGVILNNGYIHINSVLNLNLATKDLNVFDEEEPTILFASDYQGNNRYESARKIFNSVKKFVNPNLFVMCGDYQIGEAEQFEFSESGILELSNLFSSIFNFSIPQIYLQGNHDIKEAYGIAEDGIYESEKYIIYVMNKDTFPNHHIYKGIDLKEDIIKASQKLSNDLNYIVEKNENKPVFIATHIPLHYSDRDDGTDNAYSKYIIDVLNEYGDKLDIVYLFGHNHSENYDDYIGGSINYIGRDSIMQIGGTNESISINFTYLNAGYIGYSNNFITDHSTKETSATTIKVGLDSLIIQKYTKYGEYYKEPIIVIKR